MMEPQHLLCLLLFIASSWAFANRNEHADNAVSSLPVVLDRYTEALVPPTFRGHREDDDGHGAAVVCGIECQSTLQPLDQAEQERILGYETLYENGTRTRTEITLQRQNSITSNRTVRVAAPNRRKRQVFGPDGRFVISGSHFVTKYPFSTAVRLSTGCSGVLVSPKHVLTAAHCVHDGRQYLEGVRGLRVGVLQLKDKRGRGGRMRGGRRREGRRGDWVREKIQEDLEEGWEQNRVDVDPARGSEGGKRVKKSRSRSQAEARELDGGGGKPARPRKNRTTRGGGPEKRPVFRWSKVKQTRIPNGWIHAASPNNSVSLDYDYALVELKRPVKQKHMELAVAPDHRPLARIHFSGYDVDDGLLDGRGDERIVYRFCAVTKESDDLMYQHCDAQQGATGAGVYIRLRKEVGDAGGKSGRWQRKVIGVFSGHRWVELEGGGQMDFNVAVRITASKYVQICHWISEDPRLCQKG